MKINLGVSVVAQEAEINCAGKLIITAGLSAGIGLEKPTGDAIPCSAEITEQVLQLVTKMTRYKITLYVVHIMFIFFLLKGE